MAALEADFRTIAEAVAASPPDDEHDPEGATTGFERAQVLAVLAHTRQRLVDLDRAAARLRDGTYGTCERCGAAIPAERLLALPATSTCVACAAATTRRDR